MVGGILMKEWKGLKFTVAGGGLGTHRDPAAPLTGAYLDPNQSYQRKGPVQVFRNLGSCHRL